MGFSWNFGYVNWRPTNASQSLLIYESGGPLVDPDNGAVLAPAELPGRLWSQFVVGLPKKNWDVITA
jgi:hypothetical protein